MRNWKSVELIGSRWHYAWEVRIVVICRL